MDNAKMYETRRRLLGAALNLAALEVGPNDETKDAHYDASRELGEEQLLETARQHVEAAGFETW